MRVDVIDAFISFAGQARCVEVIDIRRVGVESGSSSARVSADAPLLRL